MADCSTSITVLVGDDKHAFHPDEQQLCACSPVFLSMLRNGFREAEERVVLLPEVDAETFRVFERWLSNRGESVFEDLDLALLCKVFFLMDYLQVSSVQQPLLRALVFKRDKTRSVPLSLIPFIYENTPPGSPLRQLWVSWVVKYAIPEIFEKDDWVFPEEFLRELAAAQVRHAQKLAEEVKEVWGIANSAMLR
jgi:BTB/POZ domain